MSYEKQTWECNEVITADKLNHMEDGIEEASDKGYSCEEGDYFGVFDGSVTTSKPESSESWSPASARISLNMALEYDTITVTFDGTEYECERRYADFGEIYYGAFIDETYSPSAFSLYPFAIASEEGATEAFVATENAGTHTIVIVQGSNYAEVSDCFRMAVEEVTEPLRVNVDENGTMSSTWKDIYTAFKKGWMIICEDVDIAIKNKSIGYITSVRSENGNYYVYYNSELYRTDQTNGYPKLVGSN